MALSNRSLKIYKTLLKICLWGFAVMNVIAFFHAYKFTHFTDEKVVKTRDATKLSVGEKLKTMFTGINNPRPFNDLLPKQEFETLTLQSNRKLECWSIRIPNAKGTVILFHGYGGQKSSMLPISDAFLKMGWNTFLVDFMGSGGSEGNQTTLGFKEAEEVKTCYDHVMQNGDTNIYLYGVSMGAVAIMKAMKEHQIKPRGIMLECPFGSMYKTTCARFREVGVPSFPMAGFLVFWGGVQNGFNAFAHKPVNYARSIQGPTLLMYGEEDPKVSRAEIDAIYTNLPGQKQLKIFKNTGHENYIIKNELEWQKEIELFLKIIPEI